MTTYCTAQMRKLPKKQLSQLIEATNNSRTSIIRTNYLHIINVNTQLAIKYLLMIICTSIHFRMYRAPDRTLFKNVFKISNLQVCQNTVPGRKSWTAEMDPLLTAVQREFFRAIVGSIVDQIVASVQVFS